VGRILDIKLQRFSGKDFVTEPAAHINAIDLLAPGWVSRIPGYQNGSAVLFFKEKDLRPNIVAEQFGDITGWRVLDLGCLEGGHSYQLEQLGADVLGIEANPHIFLRALVAKNILKSRATFLLGDFVEYLGDSDESFDLIFASGVLYHMEDPVELLYRISRKSDRLFLWTHYVPEKSVRKWTKGSDYEGHGFRCRYFRYDYPERPSRAYGGTAPFCNRITQGAMTKALETFGYKNIRIVADNVDHPGGPAISMVAWR